MVHQKCKSSRFLIHTLLLLLCQRVVKKSFFFLSLFYESSFNYAFCWITWVFSFPVDIFMLSFKLEKYSGFEFNEFMGNFMWLTFQGDNGRGVFYNPITHCFLTVVVDA